MKRLIILTLALVVTIGVVVDSHAEADIGVKAIGGRLGFVSPDGPDSAIGFGVLVDLGQFTPEVGFQATGDFWSKSEGSGTSEVSFSTLSIGARAIYEFANSNPKFKPYAGGGLAFHRVSVDLPTVSVPGFGTVGGDASDTELGLDLVGGAGYAASESMDILGEIRYRTGADQFDISAVFLFWFGVGSE